MDCHVFATVAFGLEVFVANCAFDSLLLLRGRWFFLDEELGDLVELVTWFVGDLVRVFLQRNETHFLVLPMRGFVNDSFLRRGEILPGRRLS